MNFAPVALALTLGYALVTGLFARGASFGDNARGTAIVVAGVALGMAMRRDPDRFRRMLGRGLQHLSWQRIVLGALSVRVLWVLASGPWLLTLSFLRPLAAVFAAGMVLGFSHWVRNTAFAFLLPGSFFLALRDGWPLRRRAVALGALGAGFLIPVLPLSYVNYLSIGLPSPMASQLGGWSLFVGANSASRGMWTKQDEALIDQRVAARTPLPGEHRHVFRERISREMALERIREQPAAYVRTILRYKVSLLWARAAEISWAVRQSRFGTCEQWMKQGVDFFHGLAMASAVVGLCWVAARRRYAWDVRQVLFWAALLTTAVHGLMEVQPRYHHMFLPTLAIAIGQIMTADDACRPPHPSRR